MAEDKNYKYNGLPFKGPLYFFKDSDSSDKKPKIDYNTNVKVFDSTDEEDMLKLGKIYTEARRGIVKIEDTAKQYDEKTGGWKVYLVWTNRFYTSPDK